MSMSTREQLIAFLAVVLTILILGMAPIVVSGIMGKALPDSLIASADKAVMGVVGVLGTVAGMIFRSNRADEQRAKNTAAAFEAISATAVATTPPPVTVAPDATSVQIGTSEIEK